MLSGLVGITSKHVSSVNTDKNLGSSLHAIRAMENPRWEDYDYEPLDDVRNRFHWLGDGNTVADMNPEADSEGFQSLLSPRLILITFF